MLLLLLPHMLANISAMAGGGAGGGVHSEEQNLPTDLVQAHSARLVCGSLCWIEVKKFG